jgi:co-chaperonin GroES (HSP10)
MQPLHDKVYIERIAGEKTTSGGIVLQTSQEHDRARVLAVGPEVKELSEGDVALVNWNAAVKAGEDLYMIREEQVLFVYEEENE